MPLERMIRIGGAWTDGRIGIIATRQARTWPFDSSYIFNLGFGSGVQYESLTGRTQNLVNSNLTPTINSSSTKWTVQYDVVTSTSVATVGIKTSVLTLSGSTASGDSSFPYLYSTFRVNPTFQPTGDGDGWCTMLQPDGTLVDAYKLKYISAGLYSAQYIYSSDSKGTPYQGGTRASNLPLLAGTITQYDIARFLAGGHIGHALSFATSQNLLKRDPDPTDGKVIASHGSYTKNVSTTSTTSVTIGFSTSNSTATVAIGSVTLVLNTPINPAVGDTVVAYAKTSGTRNGASITGTVTSWTSASNTLVINVTSTVGSGSQTAWDVVQAFAVDNGLSLSASDPIACYATTAGIKNGNIIFGSVASYNSSTGCLVVAPAYSTDNVGSGTYNSWIIESSQARWGYVWPAHQADSSTMYGNPTDSSGTNIGIAMGSWWGIPTTVDITSLGLTAMGQELAYTLQNYGMFLGAVGLGKLLYATPEVSTTYGTQLTQMTAAWNALFPYIRRVTGTNNPPSVTWASPVPASNEFGYILGGGSRAVASAPIFTEGI